MATDERKHQGDICDTYSDFDADYEKIKQLGRTGQYGTTFLCSIKNRDESIPESVDNPTQVAVKVINKQRFKDSGTRIYNKWVELQKNEITTLLLTRHPNIVRLYRVLEDAKYVYLVMEYLPGGELLDFIVATGKVSEFKVAHIVGQILTALDYMHQRDILHLDLKPENIMLADRNFDNPTVKIIDFGFAAVLPRLEKMVGHRGTPYYMAPEIWKGDYDRSADAWAVGVICFVMLFGFLPFYDDHSNGGKPNLKEIKRQIKKGFFNETKRGCGPWFPRAISVSDECKYFISHLLRIDVKRRYTVEEALGDQWCRGHASTDTLPEIVMRGLAQFVGATQTETRGLVMLVAEVNELNSTKLQSTNSFEQEYAPLGGIMKEEFVKRFGAMTNMRQHEMELMFDDLDTDGDGYISMQTVKMVESFHQLVAVDDRMIELFDKLDVDGDGVLNESDLQQAVTKVGNEVAQVLDVKRLLEVTDGNQDGVIDRDEFMAALHPKNFAPIDQVKREARKASQYAVSLRQKSALYYDLLKQCERTGTGPAGASMNKQLTVDGTFSRPTSIAEWQGEDSDGEEYDPRDHLNEPIEEDGPIDTEAVLAEMTNAKGMSRSTSSPDKKAKAKKKEEVGFTKGDDECTTNGDRVQHFAGPPQKVAVAPDGGSSAAPSTNNASPSGCCVIL